VRRARLFVLALLAAATVARAEGGEQEEAEKESFYTQATRAVIRLAHYEERRAEGQATATQRVVPDGTGFFVKAPGGLFVVTARHVVESPYDLHARVPTRTPAGTIVVRELRFPRTRRRLHRDLGITTTWPVDVAAIKVAVDGIVHFTHCTDDCGRDEHDHLEDVQAEPPDAIMVFAFPADIGLELKESRPMGRQGILALLADDEFIKITQQLPDGSIVSKYAARGAFLMDVKVFGGNSGSPIIVGAEHLSRNKLHLLGLVIGTNDTQSFAIGLPVARIREVLDLAKDDATVIPAE